MVQTQKLARGLSAVMLATSMAACTGSPAVDQRTAMNRTGASGALGGDPILFGVIAPLTGPVADAGAYVVSGLTIGVGKINAQGGVCGRPLEPIILDGMNDPQESANAAENLITREQVPIIMGAWGSSSTLAVMPVVARHGIPLVVETSSSDKITTPGTPGFDWVHRISPTSAMEAEAMKPYLVDELGMQRVAILSVNNDWGRGAGATFRRAIEEQGGQIVREDYIDQTVTDVLPQLTQINGSGADAIVMTTGAAQIATILKQYTELGMDQLILTTGGSNYPVAIMQLASPEMVNGTYHVMFYVPTEHALAGDPAMSEWYYDTYAENGYPEVGLGESYRGFDAAHVIAQAIELNDCSLDPESLNQALTRVEFAGLSGLVRFSEAHGHQSRPNVYLVRVDNGELAAVVADPPVEQP